MRRGKIGRCNLEINHTWARTTIIWTIPACLAAVCVARMVPAACAIVTTVTPVLSTCRVTRVVSTMSTICATIRSVLAARCVACLVAAMVNAAKLHARLTRGACAIGACRTVFARIAVIVAATLHLKHKRIRPVGFREMRHVPRLDPDAEIPRLCPFVPLARSTPGSHHAAAPIEPKGLRVTFIIGSRRRTEFPLLIKPDWRWTQGQRA